MRIADIQWGDDSAEKDPNLLNYFVRSDAFRRLRQKTKNIVIGRKGSGKSALRKALEREFAENGHHVVNLSPKYNSIRSVLNEKEITEGFGHEVFFQHTWLRQMLLDCLCVVGDGAKGRYASDSLEFARKISLELNCASKDFVENIADVLSKVRMKVGSIGEFGLHVERELRTVAGIEALEHHVLKLTEGGAKFVILVDDLDLGWDNSKAANNMLFGLLTAANSISALCHDIFVCVFLREDVYSILISQTQHSDKYRNVERIRWEKDDLVNILNERINFNRARHGLPTLPNCFSSVFPESVGASYADNWIVERTLGRPRELIQLARYYSESVDGDEPSVEALKGAEDNYSSWKLDDLCAEYANQYPDLIAIFSQWKTDFFRHKYHLKRAEIDDMLLEIAASVAINAPWWNAIKGKTDIEALLKILYEIGFIGDFVLGGEGGSKTFYSYIERHEPRFEEVQIHPCFRRAVGTVERIRSRGSLPAVPDS